jgi:UDP-N-acetylmuramyl pentapeptide phosphotransferase/UDP-N-acetylglucosamine-1-phosphate transferase
MTLSGPLLIGGAALIAAALTFLSGRFFARQKWLADPPGPRSSHQAPTPRTGGAAIMTGFGAAALALSIHAPELLKFAVLAFGAFALGFADDARPLPALLKLIGQIAVAGAFVFLFGAVASVPLPFVGEVALGPAAPVLTVFWIVAFMNAYNFMDGANGIAATAAIFALSALAVAAAGAGASPWGAVSVIAAAALFGFLPHNFPQARLFMGDGGSQLIGFIVAALACLAASGPAPVSALFMPTVFMPFLFDVAFTLAHRAARRRNIAEAHNEHLYQLLIRLGASHARVTTLYLGLIAVSTIAAIFAGALPAPLAFAAPAGLFLAFLAPALIIFRKASAAGLLAAPARIASPRAEPLPKAAE